MNSIKSNRVKMLAAVIGGSAVVTMGALAMSIHQQPTGTDNLAMGKMTVAATTTESGKDDTVVATSMAEMEWSEVKSRQLKMVGDHVGDHHRRNRHRYDGDGRSRDIRRRSADHHPAVDDRSGTARLSLGTEYPKRSCQR